jgi:hypothetical protein
MVSPLTEVGLIQTEIKYDWPIVLNLMSPPTTNDAPKQSSF